MTSRGFASAGLLFIAVLLIAVACASEAPAAAGEPVIFADQLQATARAVQDSESDGAAPGEPAAQAAPSSTPIPDPGPIDTPTPAPAAEPTVPTVPTATPALLPCRDATPILDIWLQSPVEPIVREANRFPTDLWVCDDVSFVSQELECLPLKTDRMYTMYVDIYGEEFEDLLTSNTIFCVAGDIARLDPASQ